MNPAPLASPLAEAMPPARMYFGLEGRIGRGDFWRHGVLGLGVGGLVMLALLDIAGLDEEQADNVVNLLMLWPAVAISAKRWHDRGRSGWWVLVALLPVIGWLWTLLENGLLPGDRGPNRYGAAPPHAPELLPLP